MKYLGKLNLVLSCILFLISCSHEEQVLDIEETAKGQTLCTISFGTATMTYAQASEAENRLESAAVFLINSSGKVFSQFITGQAGDLLTAVGADYSTSMNLPIAESIGLAEVFVVGNYYGRTTGLETISTRSELMAAASDVMSKGDALTTPLLMYGGTNTKLTPGVINAIPRITMRRMALRIDIVDKTNPAAGFTLVSALACDAKSSTMLMPGGAVSSIACIDNLSMVPAQGKLCTLYTYETSGTDNPIIQIVYTQDGAGHIETFRLKNTIPVKRNGHYTLTVSTDESLALQWNVSDMDDEGELTLKIVTWGDSLTWSGDERYEIDGSWPGVLRRLLGQGEYEVINCGIPGEKSFEIFGRQGSMPLFTSKEITLPAGTTPVEIGSWGDSGLYCQLNDLNVNMMKIGVDPSINPCIIDGIECELSWVGEEPYDPAGRYWLRRTTAGSAPVTLSIRSELSTYAMRNLRNVHANVFFVGQNGGYATSEELVEQYRQAISYSRASDYVIVGLHTGTAESRADLEAKMLGAFGDRYINLREYFVTRGMADSGRPITEADQLAMSEGRCPPSLLEYDLLHINGHGNSLIGKLVHARLKTLGIVG